MAELSPRTASRLPFDLRSLEIFLMVCETGSMAAAARQAGVSQPAVSQTITELESATGGVLFDRAVRPLGVTAAGMLLRQRASALLAEAREIAPLLREIGRGRLRLIRLGLVDSLARAVTPALSALLFERAEQASFLSGLTASHAAALLTRQLDVVLGADELEEMEGIERFTVAEEPYVMIGPANAILPKTPEEWRLYATVRPMLRFSARSKTGSEVDRHLRRLGLDVPRGQEFDTPLGLTASVANGSGWAITTPLCLHEAAIPLARLELCALPGPGLRRKLTLIARKKELGRLPREMAQVAREAAEAAVKAVMEESSFCEQKEAKKL